MSGVLVYVEHANGAPDRVSLESVAFARTLGGLVEAVVAGGPDAGLAAVGAALGAHGVATVHLAEDARLDAFAPEAIGAVIAQLTAARSPAAIVGPGTERGNEVLAHAAARLNLPMVANVLTAATGGDGRRLSRQRWAGSLIEDARLDAATAILTIAPHTTAASEVGGTAQVAPFSPALTDRDLRVRVGGREAPQAGSISLSDAKVVIGGGRGVGSAERFDELEELAGLLGAAVGVSRVVTSNGWK